MPAMVKVSSPIAMMTAAKVHTSVSMPWTKS
jgi:hypothetical protein